jgi:lipopolysaccharide biosynthesis regulator YciM
MEFDFQWLLLAAVVALPLAFGLGWLGAWLEGRQLRREAAQSPKAYYKGLNLLLNEQQDKAIDAFIEAVQNDPDTTELHFALGNLFRRRGEFERAIRVHQHLLGRMDLPATERDRAQHALAQDFMKAGLFDRAEAAYQALAGSAFATEARLALLNLYERSRDWPAAARTAGELELAGAGSFATRKAHHHCEMAQEAQAKGHADAALAALDLARAAAPQAPRPWVLRGQWLSQAGRHEEALATWAELRVLAPEAFRLVAVDYAQAALKTASQETARRNLLLAYAQDPGLDLLRALAVLDGQALSGQPQLLPHLRQQPSLTAALAVLERPPEHWSGEAATAVTQAVARAARPQQRYRCAGCGFEAQRYFWQCPGCLSWDSFPPRHLDEL